MPKPAELELIDYIPLTRHLVDASVILGIPNYREYLAMKYEDENIQLACALKSAEEFIIEDIESINNWYYRGK
ncbi:MAG: hypothetical protein LBF71_02660 [Campylobacteraceae bacterium]|nr:hypothetical protein [Campylobacteraceae bacterium]